MGLFPFLLIWGKEMTPLMYQYTYETVLAVLWWKLEILSSGVWKSACLVSLLSNLMIFVGHRDVAVLCTGPVLSNGGRKEATLSPLNPPSYSCVSGSLTLTVTNLPPYPHSRDMGITAGPWSHPRRSQRTHWLMPGTISPLEKKTSVSLPTSHVGCSVLQALQRAILPLLKVYGKIEEKLRGDTKSFPLSHPYLFP